jgi:hypothetical protein
MFFTVAKLPAEKAALIVYTREMAFPSGFFPDSGIYFLPNLKAPRRKELPIMAKNSCPKGGGSPKSGAICGENTFFTKE